MNLLGNIPSQVENESEAEASREEESIHFYALERSILELYSREEAPHPHRDLLYKEFAPLVRRLLHRYGMTLDERDDLLGEIYHRFCVLYDAYDPNYGIPIRAYIVRKLSASIYTLNRRGWHRSLRETTLEEAENHPDFKEALDPTPLWIQQIHLQRALSLAIYRLPRRQRLVILWRYYEDASFEQIARRLGIAPSTVRSLLRHGFNTLRRSLDRHSLD